MVLRHGQNAARADRLTASARGDAPRQTDAAQHPGTSWFRDQDRDAYLSCYLESERLVRTGLFFGLLNAAVAGWADIWSMSR